MMWLVKARVRPGAEFDLADEVTGGLSGGKPFAKELLKALEARAHEGAPFYFPVEGRDPEAALGRGVLQYLEVLGRTKVNEVDSGFGLDDEDEGPKRRTVKPRPPSRHRRASDEDSD